MILTEEQAKRFYRLWIPLLDFVNRKYHVKQIYQTAKQQGKIHLRL